LKKIFSKIKRELARIKNMNTEEKQQRANELENKLKTQLGDE